MLVMSHVLACYCSDITLGTDQCIVKALGTLEAERNLCRAPVLTSAWQ